MITDARVLRRRFLPSEVVHRDPEVNTLTSALKPVTQGLEVETTMLFGPSGVGKTCIARFVLDRLRRETVDVDTGYVNCWDHSSEYDLLYQVLDHVEATIDVHRQSTPRSALVDRLRDRDRRFVVVLDEFDQLENPELIYDLLRIRGLSMVLIANRERDLLPRLDERIQSRLTANPKIHFDRYESGALREILADRVRWGLEEDAVDSGVLPQIADLAAGDAREAIGILREAARVADNEQRDRITTDLVAEVADDARDDLRQKDLDRLTDHQRVVYDVLEDLEEAQLGAIMDQYRVRVKDPKSRRTVRRYLAKLEQYNLIECHGEKRGRCYVVRGELQR